MALPTLVSGYPCIQVLLYSSTRVPLYPSSQVPMNPHFRCWQVNSMELPPIYGVLGVRKVINNSKKNIKEKNYRRESNIGKS